MRKSVFFLILFLLILGLPLSAGGGDYRFSITGGYNSPFNNSVMDSNFSLGGAFRFWGIFNLGAAMYTEIIEGGDNILNIQRIDPLGIFSVGLGVRIPMGENIGIVFDNQTFYRGFGSDQGVYSFSDSWKVGVNLDLSETFGIEIYKRRLYDFSDEALSDPDSLLGGAPPEEGIDIIGVGFILYL